MATINRSNIYQTPNAAGSILYPGQASFVAYLSSTISDVTGDGTAYGPVVFDSTLVDRQSEFNTGTGTYQAGVSGRYMFGGWLDLSDLTASHTIILIEIVTSNRTYQVLDCSSAIRYTFGGASIIRYPFVIYADMDASDTAYVQVTVSNGTKVVDVRGSASIFTAFYGALLT
jgi:hypothetical protein